MRELGHKLQSANIAEHSCSCDLSHAVQMYVGMSIQTETL